VVNLSGTSYVDDAEYTRRSDGLTYANGGKVNNSEGYTNGDGLTVFSYYRKDHLGNNREVWYPNTTAQRTEYYPSGLPWSEGLNPSTQEHKYNGKEFIEMDGYDTYDYGARGLQAATMRFTSVDPQAEIDYSVSPYVYCKGNPVNNIDPFGLDVWSTSDPDEIRAALESLKNRKEIKLNDNSNWSYKSDQQFLNNNEDEGYSIELNFRKGKLYFGSSPSNGNAGIQIKYLGSTELDLGDRHFSPDGTYYSQYTANEDQKAFRFSMNVALTLLLGPAVESFGFGEVAASTLPKAVNIALKAPAAANAIKTMGNGAMIFLAQKTFQATAVSIGAGAMEGVVKSYMGPEPDMNSSIFMNPASNFGLNISSFILTGANVFGANPLPNIPDN
jgi:RHS repeat-associated protein